MASRSVSVLLLLVSAGVSVLADPRFTFPELVSGVSSRIVSGWESEEGQFPFQLSLRMVSPTGGVTACGGTIISAEWGLTAAHCTATRVTVVVRAGVVSLTTPNQIFETTKYYNHPLYIEALQSIVQPHDIGLIEFGRSVVLNDYVMPIRIQRSSDKDRNYAGEVLTASGWGRTWTDGSSPEVMNWVYQYGISNEECLIRYSFSPTIIDSTICSQYYNVTSQSTCQGDSGGPLTYVDDDGVVTQIGVTSFVAAAGCHVGMPAGFIRPGHYHEWFTQISGVDFDWEYVPSTDPVPEPTTEAAPAPTTEAAPVPTTEEVLVPTTEEAPVPTTEEAPVPTTEEAPVPTTEEEPAPTTEEVPAPTTEEAPVSTTAAAPSYNAVPITATIRYPTTRGVPYTATAEDRYTVTVEDRYPSTAAARNETTEAVPSATTERVPSTATYSNATTERVPSTATYLNATTERVPSTAAYFNATTERVPSTATYFNATTEGASSTATYFNATTERVPSTAAYFNATTEGASSTGTPSFNDAPTTVSASNATSEVAPTTVGAQDAPTTVGGPSFDDAPTTVAAPEREFPRLFKAIRNVFHM